MKILYLHGFASSFDPHNPKVLALKKEHDVVGYDVDYCVEPNKVVDCAVEFAIEHAVEAVVGTSMGGWLAMAVAAEVDIPVVAINPAYAPHISLKKIVGEGVDFNGKPYNMRADVVDAYAPLEVGKLRCMARGVSYHGCDDVVIDPHKGYDAAFNYGCEAHLVDGADHRFKDVEMIEHHMLGFLR